MEGLKDIYIMLPKMITTGDDGDTKKLRFNELGV